MVFSYSLQNVLQLGAPVDAVIRSTVEHYHSGWGTRELLSTISSVISEGVRLPAGHHGGPIHTVSAVSAVYDVATRQEGDWALMPILQIAALASHFLSAGETPSPPNGQSLGVCPSGANLREAIAAHAQEEAEQILFGLLAASREDQVVDSLLCEGARLNSIDDHYFLYPAFAARCLDLIGWAHAPSILLPVVRYLASAPPAPAVPGLTRLQQLSLTVSPTQDEAALSSHLGHLMGNVSDLSDVTLQLLTALESGLSLHGAHAALSIAAGLLYVRSDYGDPFDVHFHTGIYARRLMMIRMDVSPETKATALLTWATGPEITTSAGRFVWPLASLETPSPQWDGLSQTQFLVIIDEAISSELASYRDVDSELKKAPERVWEVMGMVASYVHRGLDPAPLFSLLEHIACADNHTEMHALKMVDAAWHEYWATAPQDRWVHLVSAVKAACLSWGLSQEVINLSRRYLDLGPARNSESPR